MSNALVFGKSDLKRIVGLEVEHDNVEIFQQDDEGNVTSHKLDHEYWILADKKINNDFARLKGDLHYKWGYRSDNKLIFERNVKNIRYKYDTYSIRNYEEACMVKDGYTFYQDLQLKDISLLSFDIETTGLDPTDKHAKILCISTSYRCMGRQFNRLFRYDQCGNDEARMLTDFFHYIRVQNPSLIIGHNILSFDLPYINQRCRDFGVDFNIGRNGSDVKFDDYLSKFRIDSTRTQEYSKVTIYGREIVDTYFLASSFDVSKSIESYALKPMIKQLGLEKEGRQYYDAGSIRENYSNPIEWEKICQYAADDAEDPIKLWDKMGPLYFNMAPHIPKPFTEILLTASGSKINAMMVRGYLQDGHSIPKGDMIEKGSFEGALSWANPGIYKNCFKIDLEALYPNIMLQYKVFDIDKDPNGYLLQLVSIFKEKRLEYKRKAAETGDKYWEEMDTTAKSILNSFYGFLSANRLNFNSLECAAFITEKAREIITYTVKYFSGEDLVIEGKDEEENSEEIT